MNDSVSLSTASWLMGGLTAGLKKVLRYHTKLGDIPQNRKQNFIFVSSKEKIPYSNTKIDNLFRVLRKKLTKFSPFFGKNYFLFFSLMRCSGDILYGRIAGDTSEILKLDDWQCGDLKTPIDLDEDIP